MRGMNYGSSSIDASSRSTGKAQTMSFAGQSSGVSRNAALARVCSGTLGLLFVISCHDALAVPDANQLPIAEARVAGKEGKEVAFEYNGQPIAVMLDGSQSSDPGGAIVTYRWLSGTPAKPPAAGGAGSAAAGTSAAGAGGMSGAAGMSAAGMSAAGAGAGGMSSAAGMSAAGTSAAGGAAAGSGGVKSASGRWVPPGESPDWPADQVAVTVMLGEGEYTFVLWVIDDQGAVSMPSTIKISIAPPVDPQVQACVNSAYPSAPHNCVLCVCGESDTCRAAADASVCGADCWGLLNCISTKCPSFTSNPMDTSCLVTNCASFLAMTATSGATMIGGCISPMCSTQCASGS
jgi:hypothetical protein